MWEEKNKKSRCMTKLLLQSNKGNAHRSAEYTTFITFELINRKSEGKATRITVFRKWEEGDKKEKAAHSNKRIKLSKRKKNGVN